MAKSARSAYLVMRERILIILPITIFVTMLGLGIVSPLMPIYAQKLGATGLWLGIIFSSFAFARMIFMPIVGKRSDVKGRKKFITYGLLFYSIFSLLYIIAHTVYSLTIIRFFHGFVSAMVLPVAMAYMGEAAPEGKEGAVMGLSNMALFLGMGFGPFLGGYLQEWFGFKSVFYVMSGLTLIAFLIALFFLPDIQFSKNTKTTWSVSLKKILKNNVMKGLLVFRAISAIGRGGLLSFLPIFASNVHIGASGIGIILSATIFISGLLQVVFGRLSDKFNKLHLIIFGSTLGVISLLLIPATDNFWELFFVCSLMGISGAIAIPAATATIIKFGRGIGMGTSMGMFDTAMSVGMMASPLISGIVMDCLGLNSVFYVAGILSLFGIFIFYYFIAKGLKTA